MGVAFARMEPLFPVLGEPKALSTCRTLDTVCFIPLPGILSAKLQIGLSRTSPVECSFRSMVWQAVRSKLLFLARPVRVPFEISATLTLATGEFASILRRAPL